MRLPEPEGWIANAVLDCLRQWHRTNGRRTWIVTIEDIEHLAKWAAELQQTHRKGRRYAFWQRWKVVQRPEQVRYHG